MYFLVPLGGRVIRPDAKKLRKLDTQINILRNKLHRLADDTDSPEFSEVVSELDSLIAEYMRIQFAVRSISGKSSDTRPKRRNDPSS